jgi:phospholipid/cholesterol/gamma-HCH transport system permease protein
VNSINGSSFQLFYTEVSAVITLLDINASMVKSAFFGLVIGIVSCYAGYNAEQGTTGVGKSANTAVVISMLLIFVVDLMGLQILNLFRR